MKELFIILSSTSEFIKENRLVLQNKSEVPQPKIKPEAAYESQRNDLQEIQNRLSEIENLTERQVRNLVTRIDNLNKSIRDLYQAIRDDMDMPLKKRNDLQAKLKKLRDAATRIENRIFFILKRKGIDLNFEDKEYFDRNGLPNEKWLRKFVKLDKSEQNRIIEYFEKKAKIIFLRNFWDDMTAAWLVYHNENYLTSFAETIKKYNKLFKTAMTPTTNPSKEKEKSYKPHTLHALDVQPTQPPITKKTKAKSSSLDEAVAYFDLSSLAK